MIIDILKDPILFIILLLLPSYIGIFLTYVSLRRKLVKPGIMAFNVVGVSTFIFGVLLAAVTNNLNSQLELKYGNHVNVVVYYASLAIVIFVSTLVFSYKDKKNPKQTKKKHQ